MLNMQHVKMLIDKGDDGKFYSDMEIDDAKRRQGPFETEHEAKEALSTAFDQFAAVRRS